MTAERESWFDEAAGPLVRPYVMTRGRTGAARHTLDVITMVVAVDSTSVLRRVEPEYSDIVALCQFPLSVAEVAAKLNLPLAVTKVLIGDLIDDGHLYFRSPHPATQPDAADFALLRTVLTHIRKL